jgi:hypothetical protein
MRAPDRFVAQRDLTTPVSDIFRITKGVDQLSTSEKLLRHKSTASDAFVYRPRLVSPMASDYRLISRSDTRAVRSRGLFNLPGKRPFMCLTEFSHSWNSLSSATILEN